jgi:hypothetical protein
MSKTSARKLPWWKIIVFSLTPGLVLFAIVEGTARIAWAHLEAEAFARHPNKIVNLSKCRTPWWVQTCAELRWPRGHGHEGDRPFPV